MAAFFTKRKTRFSTIDWFFVFSTCQHRNGWFFLTPTDANDLIPTTTTLRMPRFTGFKPDPDKKLQSWCDKNLVRRSCIPRRAVFTFLFLFLKVRSRS